jgi:hypothetical protein
LSTPDNPTAIDLAYLGLAMRKAQARYYEARRARPHDQCRKEFMTAREREKRFDAAVAAVLVRQQQTIPGMEEGGAGPG